MQQNITLRLEQSLLRSARVLAARRSTSVSGLLRDELRQLVEREEAFEQARRARRSRYGLPPRRVPGFPRRTP